MLGERAFDFTQLDTEPSQLNLLIEATDKFDLSAATISSQVTAAVKTSAWLIAKRVWNEPLRRQLWPIQVAARQTGAPNEKFRRHASWNRLQTLVQ